ncbi:MAG: helix-turn-helix transcriptional regulator [Ruminococcus sp.]|nr:helix-turn-helix transcriptional regulator [Ruminococcus sp.]
MNTYTKRLIELRKENKVSQNEIAILLETTQQQVSKYEKEIQELPIRHLIKLAVFYKTSLDYITGLTDSKKNI